MDQSGVAGRKSGVAGRWRGGDCLLPACCLPADCLWRRGGGADILVLILPWACPSVGTTIRKGGLLCTLTSEIAIFRRNSQHCRGSDVSGAGSVVFYRQLWGPWRGGPKTATLSRIPAPTPPDAPGPFSLADRDRLNSLLHSAGFYDIHIDPVDELLNLGPLEVALNFFKRMGPASSALLQATASETTAAIQAIEEVLQRHLSDGCVRMQGAIWVVKANAR